MSFQPAPRPRTSRPPETSSTVAACFASMNGAWNADAATSGPSATRSVASARAARVVHASQGPRLSPLAYRYSRWSPTQIESKPAASASRAIARSSGQRTSRSTSGSWMPTPMGRPAARGMVRPAPGGDRARTSSHATPSGLRRGLACVHGLALDRPGPVASLGGHAGARRPVHRGRARDRHRVRGDRRGRGRRRSRRLADLSRRRGHRRDPAAHRGRHRHGRRRVRHLQPAVHRAALHPHRRGPPRVAQPRPVPVRRARHRAAGGDRGGPRGGGRVACRRVRGPVRDHAHPRRRRPGRRAAGRRAQPRRRRGDGPRLVHARGRRRGADRRRHRRMDPSGPRRPSSTCSWPTAGSPPGSGPTGRTRAPTVGGRTRDDGRPGSSAGCRRGSARAASIATRSGSSRTASRSVPCGGRAPPTGPSRRMARPGSSPWRPPRSGWPSVGSGCASRPSPPRSPGATRR